MDLEDGIAVCYDYENTILNRLSVLMIFLRDNLTKIKLIPINNGYRERLEFGTDGVIYIEKNK